jgi:hypothetical protein
MKFKLPNAAYFLCFFISGIMLQACGEQKSRIVLFGIEVTLSSELAQRAHDQPFLDLIRVEKLNYNQAADLSAEQIYDLASAALSKTQTEVKPEDVVSMFVFTTDEDGSVEEIAVENTHAFSTFGYSNNVLEHRYFEKQDPQTFTEIPSLRTTLNGGFSNDDIRMLHFAAIGKNGLPARSTIYEFNMQTDPNSPNPQDVDYSIRVALLLDNERYWGASTSGLYGEEIQTALMAPQQPGGGNFCGFVNPGPSLDTGPTDPTTGCPVGADPCYNDPIAGTKKYCTKKDKGGCFAAMATVLKETGQFPDASIDFEKLWNFQDEFLLKYDLGRDYVAAYILISLFAELGDKSLKIAVDVLPHLYNAIDVMMSNESEDAVVVTPELFEMTTAWIESARKVEDKNFQNVLNRLENDVTEFQGLSRRELVKIFETRPSVSLNYQAMSVK